ncbi:hypothetical protein PB2503_03132 [Parvularcula bermudensis HTCC2503]|uniref:EF-hand domain-containing protein n=1 Tax=Parvularcula bermudensis (strain ATCC BAA-594 / HTCC2503 / KCTC 12087) TaxID=314260 RepID=E0TD44_PARBH|nr:EF-hand domain-containing protein [Parvularcula bermudensis]ADM08703.1 hypothetical protein PB2503_03132 [Parvularcula bermudensis HTCC2503]
MTTLKVSLAGTIAVTAFAAAFASAQPPMERGGMAPMARADVETRLEERFADLDQNSDGYLEASEAAAPARDRYAGMKKRMAKGREAMSFEALDTNDNQVVTPTEFAAPALASFDRLDRNGNGVIDEEERPQKGGMQRGQAAMADGASREDVVALAEARFQTLDADQNGTLTEAELTEARAATKEQMAARRDMMVDRAEDAFDQGDTDGDGRISLEEFKTTGLERFDRHDANSDGVISPDERRAASMQRRG